MEKQGIVKSDYCSTDRHTFKKESVQSEKTAAPGAQPSYTKTSYKCIHCGKVKVEETSVKYI